MTLSGPIDWDAKDMELSSGTISCIWNGFTMNGREDQYTFTEPYIDNSQVFVVAGDAGIANKRSVRPGKVDGCPEGFLRIGSFKMKKRTQG